MHRPIPSPLDALPFSRFGSYHAFSILAHGASSTGESQEGLWLRCVHGDAEPCVMRLSVLKDGEPVPCSYETRPAELRMITGAGIVRICISEPDEMLIRMEGVGLRLEVQTGRFNCAIVEPAGSWIFNVYSARRLYRIVPLRGRLEVDAAWGIENCPRMHADILPGADGIGELALEDFVSECPARSHGAKFEDAVAKVYAEFAAFAAPYMKVSAEFCEAARLAAYINWSACVGASGFLKRPAMFMSKNWMTHVWSWDHAFNAYGLSFAHPDLAWDTFMLLFDFQTERGQLPDLIDDTTVCFGFVKPPVHGWILQRMMQANPEMIQGDRLEQVYEKLSLHSRWWLEMRGGAEGLPRYYHGNDSGWDNATVFDIGFPIESADLAAFLYLQLKTVAACATRLGRTAEAARWTTQAEALMSRLLERLWDGRKFLARRATDGSVAERSDSLFGCLPVVLGEHLPETLRPIVVAEVRRHLTQWGPATENPASPLYQSDGYWRGPIWGPSTLIIVDGLARLGEHDLARDIATRFCRLCAKSGFAENYDAITGEPLRDKAFTWTASTFMVLAHHYHQS